MGCRVFVSNGFGTQDKDRNGWIVPVHEQNEDKVMLQSQWTNLAKGLFIAAAAWWVFHLSKSYVLAALVISAFIVDFSVRMYLARNQTNNIFRLLHTGSMPETITQTALCSRVGLNSLIYLPLCAAASWIMTTVTDISIMQQTLIFIIAFAIYIPQRYWEFRRQYKLVRIQDGAGAQNRLKYAGDSKRTLSERVIWALYIAALVIAFIGLTTWWL